MAVQQEISWNESRALAARCAGRFQIVRGLGRGGMGVVFLCRDQLLQRHVAIKVLRAEYRSSAEHRELFLREARFAAEFDDDAFVPVLDLIDDEVVTALVMPNAGINLREHVERHGPLPVPLVRQILISLARALAPLHRRAFVHRDVKPENVLLSERRGLPRARLCDFGIVAARMADRDVTRGALLVGSPGFMPPEQALDPSQADQRADLYSLGGLGYFALTGAQPFTGDSLADVLRRQREGRHVRVGDARPDAPSDLRQAIEKCLRPDPDARWSRAEDLIAFLERGGGIRRLRRWFRRSGWAFGATRAAASA